MTFASFLLWLSGGIFLAAGWVSVRVVDRVTHPDGTRDEGGELLAKWAGIVFTVLGAICWRFA